MATTEDGKSRMNVVYFVAHVTAYRGDPSDGQDHPPKASEQLATTRVAQRPAESTAEVMQRLISEVNKVSEAIRTNDDNKRKLQQFVAQTRRAAVDAGFDGFARDLDLLVEEHL